MLKALLVALLEPTAKLRELETAGDFTSRLALLEELKTLPLGAVWDYYCQKQGVPVGTAWMDEVKQYEADVTGRDRGCPIFARKGTVPFARRGEFKPDGRFRVSWRDWGGHDVGGRPNAWACRCG